MDFYEFVRGPMAILSFAILILGTCYRLAGFYYTGTNPKMLYPKENITRGIRAMVTGLIPFATRFMRERPAFTIITLLFHLGALLVPLFFTAHIVLWFESFGVVLPNISNRLADLLTLLVIIGCIFFFVRRRVIPRVKMVSEASDTGLLILIFISFLTGFMAFHQMGPYRPLLVLHIISGEILIALIPFTRLRHMIVYPFSRFYMGADFGNALKTRDW